MTITRLLFVQDVKKIVESVRPQDLITKRNNFSKVLDADNQVISLASWFIWPILVEGFKLYNNISSLVPFTFNAVELQTMNINDKPWTCAKEVCKALECNKKILHVINSHCSSENYYLHVDWSKDSRKDNYYINEDGMYELFFF